MDKIYRALPHFLTPTISFAAIGLLVITVILLVILLLITNNKKQFLAKRHKLVQSLLAAVDSSADLVGNLGGMLHVLQDVVEVPSYAIYILDEKKGELSLKAIKELKRDTASLNTNYSQLLPYKKETYYFPPTLPMDSTPQKPQIIKKGKVPLLFVPLSGSNCFVIGPIRSIPKKSIRLLDALSAAADPVIRMLLEDEHLSSQVLVASTSQVAVKNISKMFTDDSTMLQMVLLVSQKSIDAGGCMLVTSTGGKHTVETILGLDAESQKMVLDDGFVPVAFDELLGNQSSVHITKSDQAFFKIPPYFVALGVEMFTVTQVPSTQVRSFLVFWYPTVESFKDYQQVVLQMMAKRIGDIINQRTSLIKLSDSYVEILKLIAKLTDNLQPSTVGYSELMYRYAYITARELKLSEKDCREIALAAFLSNIGIVGISEDILLKQGKFTDNEYEKMQLHAEAGAAIIEATMMNPTVASYVRSHHERIDGYGYPDGLKGNDIPLGARILFVVQTLLAKFISRQYRPALPFEEALKQLRTASGTQLDTEVVNALIGWFNRKQTDAAGHEEPLSSCFNMRCSPENICADCPAYQNANKKCWEIDNVKCIRHGDDCAHCFIHTEYLWRVKTHGMPSKSK